MTEEKNLLKLHPSDSVGIVIKNEGLKAGANVQIESTPLKLIRDIPLGHKVALKSHSVGDTILKFGHAIGTASQPIQAGDHVHVHNVAMLDSEKLVQSAHEGLTTNSETWQIKVPEMLPRSFMGYLRNNGDVGIRNYIVVVSSVNCSATVVKAVCQQFINSSELKDKNIDGVVPVTHTQGCAQAIGGEGYSVLNRTLAGWIFHPNVVGALVIGLGCEGTTFDSILKAGSDSSNNSHIVLDKIGIQEQGGTSSTIKNAVEKVRGILAKLPCFERQTCSVEHIRLALNCGGSDSFSSLTANPALGRVSDWFCALGATVALAEIPECHGTEEFLLSRVKDKDQQKKLLKIFDWWIDYAKRHNVNLNNNLAAGNIAGGITTILEKSLGAVAKAGTSPLTEVIGYSERITRPGFVLMNTPGFDPVSVTGLVAGGCNMVAFTTGRGSVYGCSIAPTLKIATTSHLYNMMKDDMDINAGLALSDGHVDDVAIEIYKSLIDVAGGRQTASETLGLGKEEFVPWSVGETL